MPSRWSMYLGLAGGGLLVILNTAALTFGWQYPKVFAPAVVADLAALLFAFWLLWRQAMHAEQAFRGLSGKGERQEAERAQAALADTEARYAAILESAMDPVITVDDAQRIVVFNSAAEKVFRCRREEALGSSLDRFIPERFRESHRVHIEAFSRTGITNRQMGDRPTLWALRADGEEFPIEASISKTASDGHGLFTIILHDITRRKQNEDALRQSQAESRELSAQVLQVREDEKARIAHELHDELGQALTALKMDLTWIRQRLPAADTDLAAKAQAMNATLDATVAATRRISADLRPLMLDELGLADAVEWLVEDFAQRSGIECALDLGDADALARADRAVATAVYRILQESLTNVARHAHARHLRVALGVVQQAVHMEVEDDGRGITEADRGKRTSFGLRGVRERVHYLGGTIEIGAGASSGTRIALNIPLQHSEAGT